MKYIKLACFIIFCIASCKIEVNEDTNNDDLFKSYKANKGSNILIQIDYYEVDQSEFESLQTVWKYVDKNVIIRGKEDLTKNGFCIEVGDKNFKAKLSFEAKRLKTLIKRSICIMVQNGVTGSLKISELLPTESLSIISGDIILRNFTFTQIGSQLEVTPELIEDNMLRLKITPVLSYLEESKFNYIKVIELSTELIVEVGKPILIGSYGEKSESFGSSFFSQRYGKKERKLLAVLIVE